MQTKTGSDLSSLVMLKLGSRSAVAVELIILAIRAINYNPDKETTSRAVDT